MMDVTQIGKEVQVKGPQAKPSHQAWQAQAFGGEEASWSWSSS